MSLHFPTSDGASINRKIQAYLFHVSPSRLVTVKLPCCNHQVFLAHLDTVVAVFSADWQALSEYEVHEYGIAPLDVHDGVGQHGGGMTLFQRWEPHLEYIAFGAELVSYVKAWEDNDTRMVGEAAMGQPKRPHNKQRPAALLAQFFDVVGGGYDGCHMIMFTTKGVVLNDSFRKSKLDHVTTVITDFIFLQSFPVPSSGKWTKTSPAVQRLCVGSLCGILGNVMLAALRHLTLEDKGHDLDFDDSFVEWNHVVGKLSRVERSLLRGKDELMQASSAF